MVEMLHPGTYELAFDGVKVGEFTAKEFSKGVNVALLDTPNQRKARLLAKLAGALRDKCAVWRRDRTAAAMSELDDVREMLNAVRPSVSRVTIGRKTL